MSLVKSPSFTHSGRPGSNCPTSDVEPQRLSSEENTESHVVNPTEGPQEHGEGYCAITLVNSDDFSSSLTSLCVCFLGITSSGRNMMAIAGQESSQVSS